MDEYEARRELKHQKRLKNTDKLVVVVETTGNTGSEHLGKTIGTKVLV